MDISHNDMLLSNAKENQLYKIEGFHKLISFYEMERLISQGFVIGNKIKVVRKSILKNVFQVRIRDCNLIIRTKDACKILISSCCDGSVL